MQPRRGESILECKQVGLTKPRRGDIIFLTMLIKIIDPIGDQKQVYNGQEIKNLENG